MVLAIVLVLLVVGSVLFHYLSPWYFTPIASNWDSIDSTVALTLATTVGVIAMLAPGLFAWAKLIEVPKDAQVLEVLARQWNFNYRSPGADGVLGTVDARYVTDENPFGMNPDDPKGQDDILISSPELHLPVNKPVKLELRSIDVLHDFTVPQFRSKMNMVPGLFTYVWYTPTRTGTYDAFCEQLCGVAHFAMRGKVVVEEEAAFK